jgi:2-deoxy-D-gluconate 3-dehydrogenase
VATDLSGPFFLAQSLGRQMVQRHRGRIIFTASLLSFQGGINVISYAAAKSGLLGMTRALANEWAPHGVNVNAVVPGYIATDVTAVLRADPERNRAIVERIPAGHWGVPEDVAGTIVFLASAASAYVCGAAIPVDGGWLSR